MKDARKMYRTKISANNKSGKWGRRYLGGHDLVRRMDRQGEILMWCRKCSGDARQRMGPKVMNCCRPEQMATKEFGKMMKRIQNLEEGRVPAKDKQQENRGRKENNHENGAPEAVKQF